MKNNERGVFWDEQRKINVDPLQGVNKGFWGADWDLKVLLRPCLLPLSLGKLMSPSRLQLRVLRQLVEIQLCHSIEIKRIIDRAWGVVHNKHKKSETTESRPPASDPQSQENLQLVPLGQDIQRKRYWVIDGVYSLFLASPFESFICTYLPPGVVETQLRHVAVLIMVSSCLRG